MDLSTVSSNQITGTLSMVFPWKDYIFGVISGLIAAVVGVFHFQLRLSRLEQRLDYTDEQLKACATEIGRNQRDAMAEVKSLIYGINCRIDRILELQKLA